MFLIVFACVVLMVFAVFALRPFLCPLFFLFSFLFLMLLIVFLSCLFCDLLIVFLFLISCWSLSWGNLERQTVRFGKLLFQSVNGPGEPGSTGPLCRNRFLILKGHGHWAGGTTEGGEHCRI